MKKIQATIGTISIDNVRYHKGDIFEIDDEMADHLIFHNLAKEVIPKPVFEPQVKGEAEPGFESEDPPLETGTVDEPPESELPNEIPEDISLMNIPEVLDYLDTVEDTDSLEGLLEAEKLGKNRKTVVEAIEDKLSQIG